MLKLAVIGLGGFLGAIARYGLSGVCQRLTQGSFPLGTLSVNLVGCFCIGGFMTLAQERELFSPQVRLFVTMGFLGSLTTFSTFGYETVEALRAGESRIALLNVAANVVLGVAGVVLGRIAVKALGV